jgi:RNA polymerase sigma factor (sigma-70 family)
MTEGQDGYTPEQEVAWIRMIIRHAASNECKRFIRWNREMLILNETNEIGQEQLEQLPMSNNRNSNFFDLLKELNERERLILYGLYWEGWSQRELAEQLGIGQTTISKIHRQTLIKLRERMNDEMYDGKHS